MSLHFLNSLMLMGSLALTWDFSKYQNLLKRSLDQSPWSFSGLKVRRVWSGVLFSFLLIGVTGAIAALSNTLFPAASLADGLAADWNPHSHFLIRLRGLHPLMGLLLGGSIALTAWLSIQLQKPDEIEFKKRSFRLAIVCGLGICFGLATLLSLAPVWMKLVHLTFAHSIWILIVLWIRELLFKTEVN